MFTKAFTSFLLSIASSASLQGFIATGPIVANGLHISEDSISDTDASSFANGLHLEARKLETSKAGKGNKDYSKVIEAVNYVINIQDHCQAKVDELEKCYNDHEAELEECVDCAWIEVLSGTADVHCDDEIQAVCEAKAAECDRCLTECGEQQASLLSCAVDLYCPKDDEEGSEVSQ
jgi:hypothetical protein